MPVMDSRANGSGVDDRGKLMVPGVSGSANYSGSYIGNGHAGESSINGSVTGGMNGTMNGYTLMVAGQRTGKTSFLRLLLDTSDVSRTATMEQLTSVAKFVQGCSGHTSHIRTASINVELDVEGNGRLQPLALTIVDTPSLDLADETSSERMVSEMLRYVESKLAEGIEDEWKARNGDHHIHLCIYFLDPADIVPPSAPAPPVPLVPRPRTNSFPQPDPEPVILEPPVTTNPVLCRPTLPQTQTNIIRRLSARVNVLPVVARADTLTNDRLAALRLAVRRDLAEAGIGFGIFDTDNHPHSADSSASLANGDMTNGYANHANGSTSSPRGTSPTSPTSPSFLRLPYALISPDIYSHSDGVPRVSLPRHEIIHQYTPSNHHAPSSKFVRGKFVRNYRWGPLDVLDPTHSDFVALRSAIFHHMETLQKYTREYLFDKFRAEYLNQHHQRLPITHHSLHHIPQSIVSRPQLPPPSNTSRPVLAIDTAPPHSVPNRLPPLSVSREVAIGREIHSTPPVRGAHPDAMSTSTSARVSPSAPRSTKQRTKKIPVACNFCRSRKLKCDGGRPACAQCIKRSNPCDYQPQSHKRRGTQRNRKQDEDSDSDMISGDEPSVDPLMSPEVTSHTLPRKTVNVERRINLDAYNPNMAGPSDRRDDRMMSNHLGRSSGISMSASTDNRSLFRDNELPHIATLSLPGTESSQSNALQGLPLPPIRPASEQQAAQRKRASTVPGRGRATSNTGPKVVACNFCRARKTKCDGITPSCSSCARRSLPCNYNHNAPTNNLSRKKAHRASAANSGPTASPSPPASSNLNQAPLGASDAPMRREGISLESRELDLKRKNDDSELSQLQKRPRTESSPTSDSESLDSLPRGL